MEAAIIALIIGALAGFIPQVILIMLREKERETTERQLYIHKIQFEEEYKLYQELWTLVHNALSALHKVVPEPQKEASLDRKDIIIMEEAANQLRAFLFYKAPFLSSKAVKLANELVALYSERLIAGSSNREAYLPSKENIKNSNRINSKLRELSSAIRERIMRGDDDPADVPILPREIIADYIRSEADQHQS